MSGIVQSRPTIQFQSKRLISRPDTDSNLRAVAFSTVILAKFKESNKAARNKRAIKVDTNGFPSSLDFADMMNSQLSSVNSRITPNTSVAGKVENKKNYQDPLMICHNRLC